MTTTIKEIVKSETKSNININTEISKNAMITILSLGAIIGCWSMACIIGAMIYTGGSISLIYAWITAITG